MYTVTVPLNTRGHDNEQIQCEHLEEAIDTLTDSVAGILATGAKVMWSVRCPSGRTVRGDITINSKDPRAEDITDHIDYVRDVLTADTQTDIEAASCDREG